MQRAARQRQTGAGSAARGTATGSGANRLPHRHRSEAPHPTEDELVPKQKADLEVSIERLRGAIARINRTSRSLFRETFEAVDAEFRKVFPKMFSGGRAHLTLTDSEDVLESGVAIMARPPGKRNSSIRKLQSHKKKSPAKRKLATMVSILVMKPRWRG